VVYVVDKAGQVICVSRETGQVYWIRDLNNTENLSKKQLKKARQAPDRLVDAAPRLKPPDHRLEQGPGRGAESQDRRRR
jgi:hypothetical protein